jgi:autoinducer 2-degrading protein
MLITHVHVHVKPDCIDAFKQSTIENARQSVQEAGVARFDVMQSADDPARFIFVEVYRTPEAPAAHKNTAHYQTWRAAVASMMSEGRTSQQYRNIFPEDAGW